MYKIKLIIVNVNSDDIPGTRKYEILTIVSMKNTKIIGRDGINVELIKEEATALIKAQQVLFSKYIMNSKILEDQNSSIFKRRRADWKTVELHPY